MKRSALDRLLLLAASLLAAYQVAVGINGLGALPVLAYTVAFGVLLVAELLLLILGLEVLDEPVVVIISTVIPLSLSTGLVWQHLPALRTPYLVFAVAGFLVVTLTRSLIPRRRLAVLALAVVHGVAGVIITFLPAGLVLAGRAASGYGLISVGGGLIGLGGLLLAFLKAGRPFLSRQVIFQLLPGLLLLMTAAFVAGFALA
ncbi:MAG: hypothetical protein HPY59_17010 [Anaerolineae bacterium]|nr:hypothetical protein [Anaerolineae bacterium]